MKNQALSLIVNIGLLLSSLLVTFTGLLIQVCYHIGNDDGIKDYKPVLNMYYDEWSLTHEISSIILFALMVYHIALHWQLYKTIIEKRGFSKNKQLLSLSIVFILVTTTGFVPLLIDLTSGENKIRLVFIEIHDKIAFVFFIYLFLHISKRFKRLIFNFNKLRTAVHLNTS